MSLRRVVAAWSGWRVLALVVALLVCSPARAEQVRFGIFVGNNEGLPGDPELIFAHSDAAKMRDLFVELGGFRSGSAVLLTGMSASAVQRAFQGITADIQAAIRDGNEVLFVFYFSGHGDADSLHLGASRIEFANLRTWLDRTGAEVKIAMVDACQSGGLVRRKGGKAGPSFAFSEPRVESAHGTAIITSSAASELSQESAEIGGGFFTHYLHTALAGGADRNRDGEVTLSEAYAYVHTETAFRTRDTQQAQTPSWDLDVAGAGEIVLTTLEEASSRIAFLGDLEGAFSVWDESRKRYVAQVAGDEAVNLGVRPGTYYVHQRMPGWVEEARYVIRRSETHSVLPEDFKIVSYASAASRGAIDRMVRRSKLPDLSLRFVLGFRGFGGVAESYFAPEALGGVQARFLGQGRHYGGFDLLAGAAGNELTIDGLAPVASRQSTTSASGVIGFATRPRIMRAGFGARSGFTVLTRSFPEWDLEMQRRAALGVGFNSWGGIHSGRFSADLQLDWQLLVTRWDDQDGWPTTTDLVLVLGYRF